jgi:hypothetical protein
MEDLRVDGRNEQEETWFVDRVGCSSNTTGRQQDVGSSQWSREQTVTEVTVVPESSRSASVLASTSDSGSMTSIQGAVTPQTPGVLGTTLTRATNTNNMDGAQSVSEGRTDQATGEASVNRTNDGIEMDGAWDGTTGDDFIALEPEMATTETPGGFSKFAYQISGEAMKRSGDGSSQVTMGTRSQDGSLWVDGIRFPCKEAYELWLVASVRGETWARVMAMH